MMNEPGNMVFVGRRNGPVRAAKALGINFQTLATPVDEHAVRELRIEPHSVLALTEAAVLPAARLRERLGLDGLTVTAATQCTDKLAMKQAVRDAGIACARFMPVRGNLDKRALVSHLGLPLVLKTRTGSGGRGAQVIETAQDIPDSVAGEYLAESFVVGVEMSVESFVVDGQPVFTNFSGYLEPRWVNLIPAQLDRAVSEAILEVNRAAIAALGVTRGVTHMEVFLTSDGVVFGELAARPPGGHLMRLIELAYGFDPWRALLAIEAGQPPTFPEAAQRSAGVRFIYPDAGVIASIDGLEAVRALPTAVEVVCKLKPGERLEARESTGQHRGFALFTGTADQVRDDLLRAGRLLRVTINAAG